MVFLHKYRYGKYIKYCMTIIILAYAYRGLGAMTYEYKPGQQDNLALIKEIKNIAQHIGRLEGETIISVGTYNGMTFWTGGTPAKNVPLYWQYGITFDGKNHLDHLPKSVSAVFIPNYGIPDITVDHFKEYYYSQLQQEFNVREISDPNGHLYIRKAVV
jgi:hypothetical protein